MHIVSFLSGGLLVGAGVFAYNEYKRWTVRNVSLSEKVWIVIEKAAKDIVRLDGKRPQDLLEAELAEFHSELQSIRDLAGSITLEFKGGKGGD
jgi:hypothetical protein